MYFVCLRCRNPPEVQFKRPLNLAKTRKEGTPSYVNSFQFLRANKLVLSVKMKELVNGWEIPPQVMARCKNRPLTEQELTDWKRWKRAHDKDVLMDAEVARVRQAAKHLSATLRDACAAIEYELVAYTEAEVDQQWEALNEYERELEKKGYKPRTPITREPKTKAQSRLALSVKKSRRPLLVNVDDADSAEHEDYQQALRRAARDG